MDNSEEGKTLFRLCNINYCAVLGEPIDVIAFGLENWNCVIKQGKRRSMMLYNPGEGFGANVFSEGKINFFTTRFDTEWVRATVFKTFHPKLVKEQDIKVRVVNIVLDVDLGRSINLDKNFLGTSQYNGDDIFTSMDNFDLCNLDENGDSKILDRQAFPALRVTPYPNERKGINIYASGKVTSYGLETCEDIERFLGYIEKNIS